MEIPQTDGYYWYRSTYINHATEEPAWGLWEIVLIQVDIGNKIRYIRGFSGWCEKVDRLNRFSDKERQFLDIPHPDRLGY